MPRLSSGIVRRLLAVAVASFTLGTALVVTSVSSANAGGSEYDFLAKVNSSRSAHGLRPLTMSGDLQSIARSWSQHMASGGCPGSDSICHNPSLTSQVHNWRKVGENVGVGPSVSSLETAFMNSAPHRANILDPEYTQIGIGTAYDKNGQLYVTQDFRRPMTTSSSSSSSAPKKSTHHSSSTTHSTSSGTTHHSSSSSAGSSSSASSPAASSSKPHKHAAKKHRKSKNHLQDRLRAAAHQSAAADDPVRQAVNFVSTMGVLAG